jgi:Uma2 family endonuclease
MSIPNMTDPVVTHPTTGRVVPPLIDGDHLDQQTFHERYLAMPKSVRAELVGGIVFMASPTKWQHGKTVGLMTTLLFEYQAATPGVEACADFSLILGELGEPEPDCALLIAQDKGGGTRKNSEGYLEGAPELIVEVASSTEFHDLNQKRDDYEKAGVKEYWIVSLPHRRIIQSVLRQKKFEEAQPDKDGFIRSESFPGLWIDSSAVFRDDLARLQEVLRQGLASPEHAAWVKQLAAR